MVGYWEEPIQGSARVHLPTQTTAIIGVELEPIGRIARAVVLDAHTD